MSGFGRFFLYFLFCFFFLSQLNCIATALYSQLLVTSTPEQAYFPKIPCQILIGKHFRCDSKPNNKITEMFSPALLTKHSGDHNFMSFPFIEIPHWQPFCSFYDRASSCSLICAKFQRSIVSLWHSVNPWKGLCIIVSAISCFAAFSCCLKTPPGRQSALVKDLFKLHKSWIAVDYFMHLL